MTRRGLQLLIQALGQSATHIQAKAPNVETVVPRMLSQSTSKATESIVQAYGVNGREFVLLVTALPQAPERFDAIVTGDERYALDTVIPLHEEGTGELMGWRCFAKGK